MRRAVCLVTVCLGIATGCDSRITGTDRCRDAFPKGELDVVVRPVPGFSGFGEIVFVGDTLPLVAHVQPITAGYTDIWGGSGCAPQYGEPLPATIVWSSADPRIATVTTAGVVRGVAEGTVRITARAQEQQLQGGVDVAVWVRAGG